MSKSKQALAGKVALVTGATRGIGKGIATQLGEAGALVYITGRTVKATADSSLGSLEETVKVIEERGGTCIPVRCDHSNDEDVEKVFDQIKREQNGQLDVLVNNAYSGVSLMTRTIGKKFWELPTTAWDDINRVSLRNHYICSVYAARLMVPRRKGLIVNISSVGGLRYYFNVAYGVGKEACDRMAADCAFELRKSNVAMVSLWPGAAKTENIVQNILNAEDDPKLEAVKRVFENAETTEFAGKCVVHLMQDSNIMNKSGRILLASDLSSEYGFTDIDGTVPENLRSLKFLMRMVPAVSWMSPWIPSFIKL